MKKIALLLFIVVVAFSVHAQPNMSDNHTPVPVPPPQSYYPPDTTPKKPCNSKLTSFSLPCCVNSTTDVASIAKVTFSDKSCPAPTVTYTPATLSPPGTDGTINTSVMASSGDVKLFSSITLVNENIVSNSGQLSLSPVSDILAKTRQSAMAVFLSNTCAPSGSLVPSGSIAYSYSYLCCKAPGCVKYVPKYAGSATWSYGSTCHFPIFGIPWVASLDAVLSLNFSVAASVTYQEGCTPGQACADITGSATIGGGAGGTLLGGLGTVELQLTGSASLSANWCFYPEPKYPTGSFNFGSIQLQGTISTGWGLVSHTISVTLFDGFTQGF